MKKPHGSWKTTGVGIGALLTALGGVVAQFTDGDPATNPDWAVVVPLVITALVGFFARDDGVTSEQAGAK